MKLFSIFSVFSVVAGVRLGDRFDSWLDEYRVHVEDGEYVSMFEKWVANDKFIQEHNAGGNATHVLGHNQFSAMDSADYKAFLGYSSSLGKPKRFGATKWMDVDVAADSVNWVDAGAVTPVKDQGQCGSCWSFSTTGALEGAYFVKNGELVSFSEQQLVDCDIIRNGGRDQGCNGGLMVNAFSWIMKNDGLCLEADYPYFSGDTQDSGTCKKTCSVYPGSDIVKYVDVAPSDDAQMMAALTQQPVAIAIEADQREFQLYKSGVFSGTCGTTLDHGVLAVGYGTENGIDYYLVKNSWGSSWGSGGFIKLARGKTFNGGDGQCGMLLSASYPIV
jgi:C1A family cysteine protease